MKPFDLGIMVGRFQTFHIGHAYMIEKAVAVCEHVGVFVGSSQESGTAKNPFTYEQRETYLRRAFGDKIKIYPLPDIGVGNNSKWGDYVERRISWFDSVVGVSVAELYVPKIIDISASEMRAWLIDGNFGQWKRYSPETLWDAYGEMRAAVLASKDNLETQSL